MPSQATITAVDLVHYHSHGWVLLNDLAPHEVEELRSWVHDIEHWPPSEKFLRHEELTHHGPKVARIEYFSHLHDHMGDFLSRNQMLDNASALLGETAVLYKEKINFKLSGGAGWTAHQDAPAYPFVKNHISCMVAIDDATIDNGCLEVVSGAHATVLPMDEKGCITPAVEESLVWEPVELRAGQTLWFHSRTPHRSADNHSPNDRRALYPTYNALSEGDLREAYYTEKLLALRSLGTGGDRVRISLVDDFRGRPVQ